MLLIITFFLLLVVLNLKKGFFESSVNAIIIFSFSTVLITETLSFFKCINILGVYLAWFFILFCCLLIVYKKKKENINIVIFEFKRKKKTLLSNFSKTEKAYVLIIFTFLFLLFLQGILYPPNNWDSLTYHMSRIMYWIGNESVNHFPSHVLRHLYQPPFTEYVIMNINLLNGNDYFSNSVQWLFLVFSIFPFWLILGKFKISRFYKLIGVFVFITIPSLELQASTTKNDIVCGFFILSTLYLAIKSYSDSTLKNFILLGLSIGLGMLTKGTAYLFLFPIMLLFFGFILHKIIRTKKTNILLYGVLSLILLISININHYYRNYQIGKDLLNIDETEAKMFSNEKMNAQFLASNIIKNIGLHLGYPIYQESDAFIKKIHTKFKIDINNPETNYSGMNYQVSQDLITHEDGVCNTTHFLLILFALPFLLKGAITNFKKFQKITLLFFVLLIQVVLFAGFLKWQPWHTRLHIPLFMLSVVLIMVVAQKDTVFRYILLTSLPILVFSFVFFFLYNNIRPILNHTQLTKTIKISDTRFKKYFANQPALYEDYSEVLNSIYKNNPRKIGLMISDWEYPLFNQCYYDKIHIQSINVGNITNKINQDTKNIEAIICNNRNEAVILFNGHKYINQTPENEYIWFYK